MALLTSTHERGRSARCARGDEGSDRVHPRERSNRLQATLGQPVLDVDALRKRFGSVTALEDVWLSVRAGEIVGLLGPNGAGKSTLIKCVAGLLRPDGGIIRIVGAPPRTTEANRLLGYIPEVPAIYDLLTPWEHLQFTALSYELRDWRAQAEEMLQRFDLTDKRHTLPGTLSKGMRQKVMIACALLHQPALYLFDEPTVGLDPQAQRELISVMLDLRDQGAALIVSTQILSQIEPIADRAIILTQGRVAASGTLDELRVQFNLPTEMPLEDVFLQVTE